MHQEKRTETIEYLNLPLPTILNQLYFMNKKLFILLLFVFFSFTRTTSGQGLSEYSEIYLLTYEPGHELYSVFGHSALRVRDPLQGFDIVYNYGTFDFSTRFFYIKFLNGNLPYQLSKTSYNTALKQMKAENRAVLQQRLTLTVEEKNTLFNKLEQDYLPENRSYSYRFFKNNCSTRIRDLVESSIEDSIKYEKSNKKLTFRDLVHRYVKDMKWAKLGIDLMLGRKADRNANARETMFLPEYLTFHFALATVKRESGIRGLATRPRYILENEVEKNNHFIKPAVFFVILLIALLALAPRFYPRRKDAAVLDYIIFGTITFYAILLVYVDATSGHPELHRNYNLIWALPAVPILFFSRLNPRKRPKYLLFVYVGYALLVLAVMLTNRWIPQHIPLEIYPFLFIIIIHSGLKAAKFI